MIRSTLTTILLSSLLISCDDNQDEPVVDDFLGTWTASCIEDDSDPDNIEYITTISEIQGDVINVQYYVYPTSSCENAIFSYSTELPYILGEKSSTLSESSVRNIAITKEDAVVLDIFIIEQGYLYFGEERDDGLRSDAIDYTFWFEKQY